MILSANSRFRTTFYSIISSTVLKQRTYTVLHTLGGFYLNDKTLMHWLKSSDFLVMSDIQYNSYSFVGAAFRNRKKKRRGHDPNQACLENNFSPSPKHHSISLTLPVALPSHHLQRANGWPLVLQNYCSTSLLHNIQSLHSSLHLVTVNDFTHRLTRHKINQGSK